MKLKYAATAIALALSFSTVTSAARGGNDDASSTSPVAAGSHTVAEAIRPFRMHVSAEQLADLRKRLEETRWPDKETVSDRSQGAQLEKLQALVKYWGTNYDWRKAEARLNALPQFVTNIDGVDIHFIWVRSKSPKALPLLITHGWPGSVFEFTKVIGPLTDPTAFGGKDADAFDLVIPSIPGYGLSGKPTDTGWGPERIAHVWAELMSRLGYSRYVAQGGDWGALITTAMAREAPKGLLGIHLNLPASIPPEVAAALATGGPAPAGLSDKERATFDAVAAYSKQGATSYITMLGTRPQTIGYGVTDSPAFMAAFMLGHPGFVHWDYGNDPKQTPSKDEVLDDFTLYWLTDSAASAGRLYWENKGRSPLFSAAQKTTEITLPVAVSVFQEDAYRPPESWTRRAYPHLIYFHEAEKGGHFAAWEQPQLFAKEVRAGFRPLREQVSEKQP
ncbi:epoxide hydrolase family protein [Dyella humicola]|uniref:epoxide hydrolase family protein n=1 Tax=Dyella humicola TaxID=2992126 RepID=UPI0022529E0F|nr:epoxide hydrolase family protein [Dyella humicola]